MSDYENVMLQLAKMCQDTGNRSFARNGAFSLIEQSLVACLLSQCRDSSRVSSCHTLVSSREHVILFIRCCLLLLDYVIHLLSTYWSGSSVVLGDGMRGRTGQDRTAQDGTGRWRSRRTLEDGRSVSEGS